MPADWFRLGSFKGWVCLIGLAVSLGWSDHADAAGYVVAIGGGAEEDAPGSWSQKAYGAIVAAGNGGSVVILSDLVESEFLPRYFERLGASRAENVRINTRAVADSAAIAQKIRNASIVFLRGGDQSDYVSLWDDTATEAAIQEVHEGGGVVAGTSAGAAVLGELIYTAENGSVFPEEAIRNPYDARITFTTGFLELLPGVLFEPHFTQRGRIGRLVAFLGRDLAEQPARNLLAIGVDDQTACFVDPDGHATVIGQGAVTMLRRTTSTQLRIQNARPPVLTNLAFDSLTEGFVFDLVTRAVTSVPANAVVVEPAPAPAACRTTTLDGGRSSTATVGSASLGNVTTNPDALYQGRLTIGPGSGRLGQGLVVPLAYGDVDLIENRVGGWQWGLAKNPHFVGVLMDPGSRASLSSNGRLTFQTTRSAEPATLILDTRGISHVAFSTYVTGPDSVAPRQSVALVKARLQVLASGWRYNVRSRQLE